MTTHTWKFKRHFRFNAFGWREKLPVQRTKEAVREIKAVARKDPILGAEGAVAFIERVSPALEQVDSSSGRIGTAVSKALDEFVPIIATAPADEATRADWLERLFEAISNDDFGYLNRLNDDWGTLCGSAEVASQWADELLGLTRRVLVTERAPGTFFHGSAACLSALYRAGRHDELLELLTEEKFWHYKRWGAMALAAQGELDRALALAEASRGPWTSDHDVDRVCERLLLEAGRRDDAYRYGLRVHRRTTYDATFKAIAAAYPEREPRELLADLVAEAGDPGKWFAAAKNAGLYREAADLARRGQTDARTLTRAARDFADSEPAFAAAVGIEAVREFTSGLVFDVRGADVQDAVRYTMKAAENLGRQDDVRAWLRQIASNCRVPLVADVLNRELGE